MATATATTTPGDVAEDLPSVVMIAEDDDSTYKRRFSFRRLLQFMGPGLLMSIAYVDPGNLESDLQVGAQAGYVLLWLLLLSTAMGFVVQMQAAKLGVVTGRHLAQHCREHYPPLPRYALWIMAEIAIIGSDIQEVIGSAIALSLLSGGRLPLWGGVLLTAVDSFALLFIERLGIRFLEAFFGVLIGIMVVAFGVMYQRADVPVAEVVRGFTVPSLPRKDVPVAVALLGSLIMPHNIYLHSALVQTRKLGDDARGHAKREALGYFAVESGLSLGVAVVINLFITAVFAAGFYGQGIPDIGLQSAGRYLGSTYGTAVVYIWALGLLAAGQSSTMTGTYTGQFVMSGYLDLHVSPWARIAITRLAAIAPTLAVALAFHGSAQLDVLNQGLNLLQSIQLPFALIPVLTFASSPEIMGDFANSALTAAAAWGIAVLVVLINLTAVYEVAYEAVLADPWVTGTCLAMAIAAYFIFVGYLLLGPHSVLLRWLRIGRTKRPAGYDAVPENGCDGVRPGGGGGSSSDDGAALLSPGGRVASDAAPCNCRASGSSPCAKCAQRVANSREGMPPACGGADDDCDDVAVMMVISATDQDGASSDLERPLLAAEHGTS